MPKIKTNDIMTYYEIHGEGYPFVFIHGGWVSHRYWNPQVEYFSGRYKVITYDIRGHGESEGSDRKYSIELFADDLKALIDNLNIGKPYVCGLSLGGFIAQTYAVKYPEDLRALLLADTGVSSALTLSDRIQRDVLFPRWLLFSIIRIFGLKRYYDFGCWLAKITRGEKWYGFYNKEAAKYVRREFINFKQDEFLKVFDAIYNFTLQDLAKIKVPTLIIHGEFGSKPMETHSKKMKELIKNSSIVVIPNAGHMSNWENVDGFNKVLEDFLREVES